jgi:hypothetical protein
VNLSFAEISIHTSIYEEEEAVDAGYGLNGGWISYASVFEI